MAEDIILRTTNLGKRYKDRWAAEDVNLEIYRGDVFGFFGTNRCGEEHDNPDDFLAHPAHNRFYRIARLPA